MTRLLRSFLWLVILCVGCVGRAVWAVPDSPPFGVYPNAAYSPTITVLESDSVIRLDLLMEHLPHGGYVNLARQLPGLWGEMDSIGARLPRFTIYLALPGSGNPVSSIESWVDTVAQAGDTVLRDNSTHPPHVSFGHVGILGGVRVVPVTIWPITYDNHADTCTILSHAIVRVSVDGATGENPVTTPRTAFSRPWQRLLQTVVTNWTHIPNINTGANSHILMVVPDTSPNNYLPTVQPFIRWKEQRGFKVTVVPKSSMGASVTPQAMHDRILTEVNNSDPHIDYVILVGDETRLPVSMLNTPDPVTVFNSETDAGSYTNELYFSAIEGNDVFPDVFVGRWVVNTATEVQNVSARSIMHERDTFGGDSLRFRRGIVAADRQARSQVITKLRVRDDMLNEGFSTVDSIFGRGHVPALEASINQGCAFINYRGQGWWEYWWGIGFLVSDLASLNNPSRLPIVTGIGCGSGIFYTLAQNPPDNGAFGEAFMLGGTATHPTGCVGFIGPCWNTHTIFNDCLDSLLYRGWFDYGNLELSPGLAAGKMMTWALFNAFVGDVNIEEVTKTMMRQYHVESDPTLQVFTQTPVRLQVTMPDSVIYGAPSALSISIANMSEVPAESLNVTVWLNDSTSDTYWVPPTLSSIDVRVNALITDTVVVTITGDNCLAYQKTLLPASPDAAKPNPALIPRVLELAQNFPNPFNPETTIEFVLPKNDMVKLEVYDLLGRRIATLIQGGLTAGQHRLVWRGSAEDGNGASSGIYYYRLTTSSGTLARKMLLIR